MTKHKRKRGRPVGTGKSPPAVRAYWRRIQQDYRAKKISETVTGKT